MLDGDTLIEDHKFGSEMTINSKNSKINNIPTIEEHKIDMNSNVFLKNFHKMSTFNKLSENLNSEQDILPELNATEISK